jgi:hypothetical protein
VLKALVDREESLDNFARFPHAEGVRGKLLQLARRHGKVTKEGIAIDLPLTRISSPNRLARPARR